jgi:hypothetical protein
MSARTYICVLNAPVTLLRPRALKVATVWPGIYARFLIGSPHPTQTMFVSANNDNARVA